MNSNSLKYFGLAACFASWSGCDSRSPQSVPAIPTALAARDEAKPVLAQPTYPRDIAPLIGKYCSNCHSGDLAEGGVALDDVDDGSIDDERRKLWLRVAAMLSSASMPPEGKPRPTSEELETINTWLDRAIFPADTGTRRSTVRRLNRAEYNNTIRDLIGLDLRPAEEFPSDDIGHGFDNNGDVLSMSSVHVEMYLAAADGVIEEAFASPEVRHRIMNPPPDAVPRGFRRFQPPVVSRGEKRLYVPKKAVVDPELEKQQRIYDILRGFADRAFRRPATHEELMRLLGIVQSAESDGEGVESAIRLSLRAVLVSPHFLFRVEPGTVGDPTSLPIPDNDFALASRLSYFLWSSMPDEELLRLAAQGELRRGDNLRAQVRRMLRDRRSRALAENFASQWLQTRKLKDYSPDPVLFPDFDESLRSAMLEETERFFASIQDEDRSVLEFLDADYTFVNDRLARHYGLARVEGGSFRRVSLAGTSRGGVLTHASILTVTSNPTRTSPVKRGKWILENILGTPPAPPPSGVEALKENQGLGTSETLRQRMERHRTEPGCASCHSRMDPLGFGLENFDAVGGWRTLEDGRPIDPSVKPSGGRSARGPAELRAVLSSRRDAFVRCFTEKMLTYALGRGLSRADRRDVDRIVAGLAGNGYRFSALVLGIAESEPFRASEGRRERP
jgi:hypothetical protein